MPIVTSDSYALTQPATFDANNPVIGWQNVVTATNVRATLTYDLTEDVSNFDWPVSNLGNPSTFSRWEMWEDYLGLDVQLLLELSQAVEMDYIGLAAHNLATCGRALRLYAATGLDTATEVLLHFNGDDASTDVIDAKGNHTFTANGNAQLDDAQARFGETSLLCDQYAVSATAPTSTALNLGSSDWTIEQWFYVTNTLGDSPVLSARGALGGSAATDEWLLYRDSSGFIILALSDGATYHYYGGVGSAFSNAQNVGWHRVLAQRSGNSITLVVDDEIVAQGTFTGAVNTVTQPLNIGAFMSGWVDEFRLTIGEARLDPDDLVPLNVQFDDTYDFVPVSSEFIPDTDRPLMVRFDKDEYLALRLVMTAPDDDSTEPRVGIMYAGELLTSERKIQTTFVPLPFGRKTTVLSNMSERGQFLGRIETASWVETACNLAYLSPDWYRTYMEPFMRVAMITPFFFAWAPESYPDEVGFAWLTQDPIPTITHTTNLMQVTLQMQGIAEGV